jgi:hypothetical protein
MEDPDLLVKKTGAFADKTGSLAGHGQVLARRASDNEVDRPERGEHLAGDPEHAAEIRNVRIVVLQHGARERRDLCHADARPTERLPGDRCGFYPAEKR